MKQAEAHTEEKAARKNSHRSKALLYRRIGAGILVALAIALCVYIYTIGLSPAALMLGAGAVLLLLEALLLWVDLPVSRALQGVLGVLCIALLAFGFLDYNYVWMDAASCPNTPWWPACR